MKKMIVLAVMGLFGTQFAKAQVAKGDFLVGGNVNFATSTTKPDEGNAFKNTTTGFGISPKVGYALSDKWMIGVFANSTFSTEKEVNPAGEDKTQSNMITPGIFVRNYHVLGGSKFAFFGEANVGYGFGKEEVDGVETAKLSGIQANILPGISYFVTKCFVLEGTFGGIRYANEINEAPNGAKVKTNSFGLTFPREFSLGVSFLF